MSERVNAAIVAEELGAEVEETSLPRSVEYGLACYYLVAPAEASSNLARYDGVRYGFRAEGTATSLCSTRTRWEGFGAEPKRRIPRDLRPLGRLLRRLLRPGRRCAR